MEKERKREFNLVQVTRVKIKCLHLFVTSAKLVCELVDKLFKVFFYAFLMCSARLFLFAFIFHFIFSFRLFFVFVSLRSLYSLLEMDLQQVLDYFLWFCCCCCCCMVKSSQIDRMANVGEIEIIFHNFVFSVSCSSFRLKSSLPNEVEVQRNEMEIDIDGVCGVWW